MATMTPVIAPRLLVIEDDEGVREVLRFNLEDQGFRVDVARDGGEGLALYDASIHHLIITDLNMPGVDGMRVLDQVRARSPNAPVIVLTAYGSTERAIEAMRRGAYHYVEKPIDTLALVDVIRRALSHAEQGRGARAERAQAPMIAVSPAMNRVLQMVDKIAPSDAPVCILGESGTGKELVARALHTRSPRAERGAFVAVNCAAIPPDLLESMLFGHTKGAFTGATRDTPGKFAAADGGTLFLDEIAEMSPELQSKLLRVLQDGLVERVGEVQPVRVDARVITATHQDLDDLVRRGVFRQDLYYRLNVVPITLPPLRDRPEDIPVLSRHFVRQLNPEAPVWISREVDDAMIRYTWPGNVRELRNVVERMLLLRERDELTTRDLPASLRGSRDEQQGKSAESLPFSLPPGGLDLMALERRVIIEALRMHEGNQSATARYLRIPRHVLLYRLEKYAEGQGEEKKID